MRFLSILVGITIPLLSGCENGNVIENKTIASEKTGSTVNTPFADAPAILTRKEVPVLCYHNIRNFRPGESDRMKSYTVTPSSFAEQMRALSDSGYHTIHPDELFDHLTTGKQLPPKPIILSFDDTDLEHYSIASKEMNKYGFKGLYFIMTIAINKPKYMSNGQLKELSDSGNTIASHTWDHHMVTKYAGSTWDSQLVMPKKKLEEITGSKVNYFAYPFGLWNRESIPEIKKRDYKMAFILSGKRDSINPLFTIRRMIVPGTWTTAGMFKAMKSTFKL